VTTMTNPDSPQDPQDPQDDTTFGTTADDTTQLEQTMHTETTERLDTTDSLDDTRTIGAEQPSSTDLFGNPVAGSDEHDWPPALPERPSGPHAPAIVLGLVCLVVAGIIFAQELGGLTVDWGDVGPVGIILTGAVLVLFGLVGLLSSRRNSKTG